MKKRSQQVLSLTLAALMTLTQVTSAFAVSPAGNRPTRLDMSWEQALALAEQENGEMPSPPYPGEFLENRDRDSFFADSETPVIITEFENLSDPFVFMTDEYAWEQAEPEDKPEEKISAEDSGKTRSRSEKIPAVQPGAEKSEFSFENPDDMFEADIEEFPFIEDEPFFSERPELVQKPQKVDRYIIKYAEGSKDTVLEAVSESLAHSEALVKAEDLSPAVSERIRRETADDVVNRNFQDEDETSGESSSEISAAELTDEKETSGENPSKIFAAELTDEKETTKKNHSEIPAAELSGEQTLKKSDAEESRADSLSIAEALAEEFEHYEVLVLKEPVLPSEFAQELRDKGLEGDIRYIQPDYELHLESLSLELLTENNEDPDGEVEKTLPTPEETEPEDIDPEVELPEPEEEIPEDTEEKEPGKEPEILAGKDKKEEDKKPDEKEKTENRPASKPPIVAIIDSGFDTSHEIFDDITWLEGKNFPAGSTKVFDPENPGDAMHGTHVAGVIAQTLKEYDLTAELLPLKVFENGRAYTSDIIAAIEYADAMGADIINMSFGSTEQNPALFEAIANSKTLVVAAAGNSRKDMAVSPTYPAAYTLPNLVSVASVNSDGGFSYFSNYGNETITLAAEGRQVESALPGNTYGQMTGTSASAAKVSGAAAVVLASGGEVDDKAELKTRLVGTADRLSNLELKVIDSRRLNIANAVAGTEVDDIIENYPEDDFDVHGYQPETDEERWELFAAAGKVVQVEAGIDFTVALTEDGHVWVWGSNLRGQYGDGTKVSKVGAPTQAVGLNDVIKISFKRSAFAVVKSDGTVWAWGADLIKGLQLKDNNLPQQVVGLTDVASVTAILYSIAVLKNDGTVWGLGENFKSKYIPEQIKNMTDVNDITSSNNVFIAVKTDGSALVSSILYILFEFENVNKISSAFSKGILVKHDGTVWTGNYNSGILDLEQIEELENVIDVSISHVFHYLALKEDGTVWSWGNNTYGQLGDGTYISKSNPVQVIGLKDIVSISAGGSHSAAIDKSGQVWTWGSNDFDQLGVVEVAYLNSPEKAYHMKDITKITSTAGIANAVKTDGSVFVWGNGSNIIKQIDNLDGVIDLVSYSGYYSPANFSYDSVIVKNDASLWFSGNSNMVKVEKINNVVAVAGYKDSKSLIALKNDGTVWWIDRNGFADYQIDELKDIVAISVGENLSALTSDGYVWVCNDGRTWHKTKELENIIQISEGTGGGHRIALKSDGTVWTWGANSRGQLGNGTRTDNMNEPAKVNNLENVVSIAAGSDCSIALKEDGTVWTWGLNKEGQLGHGTTADSLVPVQAVNLKDIRQIFSGDYCFFAVDKSDYIWAVGSNYKGQLGIVEVKQPQYNEPIRAWQNYFTTTDPSDFPDTIENAQIYPIGYENNLTLDDTADLGRPEAEYWLGLAPSDDGYYNVSLNSETPDMIFCVMSEEETALSPSSNGFYRMNKSETYYVKITYDGVKTSEPINFLLDVNYADDHPDSIDEIEEIKYFEDVTSLHGRLERANDLDWFAVKPEITASYNVGFPSGGASFALYGPDREELTVSDGKIRLEADSVYYIKISADLLGGEPFEVREYALHITPAGSLPSNPEDAPELPFDPKGNSEVSDRLRSSEDVAWYCLSPASDGLYALKTETELANLGASVMNSEQEELTKTSDGFYQLLRGQNYFLKLWVEEPENFKAGNFKASVEYSNDYANHPEDAVIKIFSTENTLYIDGKIDFKTDKDYIAFEVLKSGLYTAELISEDEGVRFSVSDRNGKPLASEDGHIEFVSGELCYVMIDYTGEDYDTPVEYTLRFGMGKEYLASNTHKIAGRNDYAIAVKQDGSVWVWGNHFYKQAGTPSSFGSTQVRELGNIVSVAAGRYHALALDNKGTVYSFGRNSEGQLGNGVKTDRYLPGKIKGLVNVVEIGAGDYYSAALKGDGSVWVWGGSAGSNGSDSSLPVKLGGNLEFKSISCAADNLLLLTQDGLVYEYKPGEDAPVKADSLENITAIASGDLHKLALKEDGSVWAWGSELYSALGTGNADASSVPVKLDISEVKAIAAGRDHSLAVRQDGTVYGWGYNNCGQTGNKNIDTSFSPTQITGLENIIDIAGGRDFSLAMKEDGTLYGFGANASGQAGGTGTLTLVPTVLEVFGETEDSEDKGEIPEYPEDAVPKKLADDPLVLKGAVKSLTKIDYFALDVVVGGTYSAEFECENSNVKFQIFDEKGKQLYLRDGKVTFKQDETSFIKVYYENSAPHTLSDYRIILTLQDDHPDTPEEAEEIPMEIGETLVLKGRIHRADDIDWLKFRAAEDGYFDIEEYADSGILHVLYDQEFEELPRTSDGMIKLKEGEVYYLKAEYSEETGFVPGWFEVKITYSTGRPNYFEDAEIEQVPKEGIQFFGKLRDGKDTDRFAVTPGRKGLYEIKLAEESSALKVTVFDEEMAEILPNSDGSVELLNKKVYYISVKSTVETEGPQEYELLINMVSVSSDIGGNIEFTPTAGENYFFAVNATGIETFEDTEFTLKYDPAKLELVNFAVQTGQTATGIGNVGDYLTIISHSGGELVFECTREIPENFEWSGLTTLLEFKALTGETAAVTLS